MVWSLIHNRMASLTEKQHGTDIYVSIMYFIVVATSDTAKSYNLLFYK